MRFCVCVVIAIAALLFLGGCTFHFKATDVELDSERQRVEKNLTYELEKVAFLDG